MRSTLRLHREIAHELIDTLNLRHLDDAEAAYTEGLALAKAADHRAMCTSDAASCGRGTVNSRKQRARSLTCN
jgi:hypothetical protein